MRGKAITGKTRDEIEAMLNANVPHSEIAAQFGLTLLTIKKISHLLNKLGKTK